MSLNGIKKLNLLRASKETLRVKDEELQNLANNIRARDATIKEIADKLTQTAEAAEAAASAAHKMDEHRRLLCSEIERLRHYKQWKDKWNNSWSRLVDLASRLIAGGAARLFSTVFRKRLDPAPAAGSGPAEVHASRFFMGHYIIYGILQKFRRTFEYGVYDDQTYHKTQDKKVLWEDVSEWYQETEPPQGFQDLALIESLIIVVILYDINVHCLETLRVKDEELQNLANNIRARDATIKEIADKLTQTAEAAEAAASAAHKMDEHRRLLCSEIERLRHYKQWKDKWNNSWSR
ncbi:hypothetical protein OsI_12258 [Oryza sativa Indica Group]|uniref:Uncharacterized protein n=1 Tax=Oryza sativa subsp. indica TaxID=39946 RepID=B8AKS9_ORYSI|nr:hypothetical protein OsI_12258 [Oryza sativa Indica Group]